MSVPLINFYIKTKASKPAVNQGWGLYTGKFVRDFLIHEDGKTAEANVLDEDEAFTVVISDFKNMNISAECNCFMGNRTVCRHSVAVLLKLVSELDGPKTGQSVRPDFVKRKTSQSLHLENFEKLSSMALSRYLQRHENYYSDQQVFRIQLTNEGLSFVVSSLYDDYEYLVRIYQEEGKYYSYCSCDKLVKFTCEHERAAIAALMRGGKTVLKYFEKDKLAETFKKISTDNDIPEKYATPDNIRISIDNHFRMSATFHGPLEGLISEHTDYGERNFLDFFGEQMKLPRRSIQNLFEHIPEKKRAVGFVFIFDEDSDHGFELVKPVSGNVNKAGNKLTSGIFEISVSDLPGTDVNEQEKETIILCEQLHGLDEPDDPSDRRSEMLNLRKSHEYLRRLYELLSGNKMIYQLKDPGVEIRKTNLQQVGVSPEPVEFGARLESNEDFISLVPEFTIGERVFDIRDRKLIRRSRLIWELDNTFYIVRNVTMLGAINFMAHNSVLKTFRSRSGEFISKIVVPFSERFNIDIDGLNDFETDEVFLKPLKKQVYISEFKGYILFTPVVVYNHKKEAEVMTGGNFIEQTDSEVQVFKRDYDFESEFLKFLRHLHPDFSYQEQEKALGLALDEMLENNWFFDAFEAMKKQDIEVLGLKKLKSFNYSPHRAKVSTGIKSGVDWFDVDLEVKFGDHIIPLNKLKKHILNREKYIRLGDGTVGMLPDEWIGKLEKYFRAGEVKDDKIQVSKLRFGIVDELFEKIEDTAILEELAEKKKRLESFTEISKIRKPRAIKATLRDYQKEGLNWLNFLNEMGWGGILADDMGLGKTLQILSLLAGNKNKRPKSSLVVVPTTLIFNWQNEITKFYPTLNVYFHYGNNREKNHRNFTKYNLVVTTYGLMVNDIELLSKAKFNYVILDESQAIKNPLSKRYKAACLLQGKNKLTLTGTPIENNTFDLFAQMSFVNPGLLGTQKSFKDYYSTPIDKDKDSGRAGELRKMISPFVMRRTKEQVATELPPKTEDVLFCTMESVQQAVYEDYRRKYRDLILNKIDKDGLGKTKMSILDGLLRLRQICNNPALIDGKEKLPDASVKLEELMRQINEKTGKHKVVVFSQFVKMLKLIEKELNLEDLDYAYFDGSSSQKKRRESVTRFQEDENCRIFLISLKAGGTGINLTAADYVYIFDPWWNPAVENQAIDRTYRIGQDKKVFAYRMICKDTVEEKIMKYQDRKKALAADIIRTDESFVKQLDKESIMELFG